jgi:hypothetical protein
MVLWGLQSSLTNLLLEPIQMLRVAQVAPYSIRIVMDAP